ncbi:uncharacterized protein LOC135834860 [Planococcus citri]|uniref:uncharacterized protein LOC135834860 n=1 Tax=Planococcus citri TaxID=170843 RepID=UPI0031F7C6EA
MRFNLLIPSLFACVFQSTCLLVSGALSGEFDLKMVGKGDTPPYKKLKDLVMVGNNTVPAARHHIIPRNRIREFYNKAVAENQMKNLRLFLTDYKKQFKQLYAESCGKYKEAIESIEELVDGLIAGTVVHKDKSPRPKNYSFFVALYTWLPGNLFEGPDTGYRAYDPNEEFEYKSERIIGEDDFKLRFEINKEMKEYISQGKADFGKVDANLQRMLTTRKGHPIAELDAYPFNKDDWIAAHKKGKYKIKV